MKTIAKWFLIIWSLFCLFGIIIGLLSVSEHTGRMKTDLERGATSIGIGCGMTLWFGLWIALAGPALIIYLVSGRKELVNINIITPRDTHSKWIDTRLSSMQNRITDEDISLCDNCNNPYLKGKDKYCTWCGKKLD